MSFGFQSIEQQDKYAAYRAFGWEYQHTEPTGEIVMAHKERGYDYVRTLSRVMIGNDGTTDELPAE